MLRGSPEGWNTICLFGFGEARAATCEKVGRRLELSGSTEPFKVSFASQDALASGELDDCRAGSRWMIARRLPAEPPSLAPSGVALAIGLTPDRPN